MNKKRLAVAGLSVGLVAVAGIGATLAYFTDQDATTNVVEMGHVDIELDEPIFSRMYVNNTITNVVPNQSIKKDPTIAVGEGSEDCYLRVQLTTEYLDNDQKAEILNTANIDKEDWTMGEDGYLYFQDRVKAGDVIPVFDTITVPAQWGNEVADLSFEINIQAEAIQANYFEPMTNEEGKIIGWVDESGKGIEAETYNPEVE